MSRISVKHGAHLIALLAAASVAGPVLAHDGHHTAFGLAAGLSHPLSGLDHWLAMLAVGFWVAQQKPRARWMLPAAFLAAMMAGAWFGLTGWRLAGAEIGIAGSVAVLGVLIVLAVRLPVAAGIAVISLCALTHGYAHGVEGGASVFYVAGFVVTTVSLLAAGLAAGRLAAFGLAARLAGAGVTAAGVYLLAGAW